MLRQELSKRGVLVGGAAALASLVVPTVSQAAPKSMIAVLESEVVILDPHATTAAITRTFAYHVFDTLFSMDMAGTIHPQMVDTFETAPDGLSWRFKLRDGLSWHDGAPVKASDCVASLKRWARGDALGKMLMAAVTGIEAVDERSFRIVLREAFPLMLDVLGKPNAPVPAMMPERILPPGDERIKEIIGSGPFKFKASAWRPGDRAVLERFEQYKPRAEKPDFLAGAKVVKVDEVVLRVMPDDATATTALIAGEIDYMQYLPFDWLDKLEKAPNVNIMALTGLDMFQGNFRLNHATGPFADRAVREVLWKLVDQGEVLQAIGIPDRYLVKNCPSFFMCDAPLSSTEGAATARLAIEEARAALKKTAYKGEPVVFLSVAGSISQTAGTVLADNMRKAGFTVDEQVMDWGTVLARRAKKEGWGIFPVYANGIDMMSPLTHFYIGNNCANYAGWSCDAVISEKLAAYARAPDPAMRKRIAAEIQVEAYKDTPSVMWGQFSRPAGYRSRVKSIVQSSFPMFWQLTLDA
ncbi:ABC transporter substrate-binding protein [Bosea sp. 685]|uniref:ABC transporter substrate-binding protein n=1 Tax=Bosea sp. 685 TaxID=3080057 RepID=UPI0028932561|nr:ABC transporter substrate-binding protein [Bosea sp. 685]WNJ91594.1 ABC transporter substrate-binding protein [Bosea sp. 685]